MYNGIILCVSNNLGARLHHTNLTVHCVHCLFLLTKYALFFDNCTIKQEHRLFSLCFFFWCEIEIICEPGGVFSLSIMNSAVKVSALQNRFSQIMKGRNLRLVRCKCQKATDSHLSRFLFLRLILSFCFDSSSL